MTAKNDLRSTRFAQQQGKRDENGYAITNALNPQKPLNLKGFGWPRHIEQGTTENNDQQTIEDTQKRFRFEHQQTAKIAARKGNERHKKLVEHHERKQIDFKLSPANNQGKRKQNDRIKQQEYKTQGQNFAQIGNRHFRILRNVFGGEIVDP